MTELFNLSPEQTDRANDTFAAIRVAIESLRQALGSAVTRFAQLKLSPEAVEQLQSYVEQLQRYRECAASTWLQLANYIQPNMDALGKLLQDPEWRAMIKGAAKNLESPLDYLGRVPLRRGPEADEPVEVPLHRRTGFKLPGVNDS